MKKYVPAVVVIVLMTAASGAWAGGYDRLFTDSMVNGMGFIEKDPVTVADTEIYTYGCMDALFCTYNEAMTAMYPHTTKKDILDAVKLYYENNPYERTRPILQVLLAGCK